MKDFKTIKAEIDDFYNKNKNLSKFKRLKKSEKEVKDYLDKTAIDDDMLLKLHKYFKYEVVNFNLNMLGFMVSYISGALVSIILMIIEVLKSEVLSIVFIIILSVASVVGIFAMVMSINSFKNVYYNQIVAKIIEGKLKSEK